MSIFVPHNIESRVEKLRQDNIKLLQQSKLSFYQLILDKSFDINAENSKVEYITGSIYLDIVGYIPEWLSIITLEGNVWCTNRGLYSLKNCPSIIKGDFESRWNRIQDLKYFPKYIGGDLDLSNNSVKFTKQQIRQVCEIKGKIIL